MCDSEEVVRPGKHVSAASSSDGTWVICRPSLCKDFGPRHWKTRLITSRRDTRKCSVQFQNFRPGEPKLCFARNLLRTGGLARYASVFRSPLFPQGSRSQRPMHGTEKPRTLNRGCFLCVPNTFADSVATDTCETNDELVTELFTRKVRACGVRGVVDAKWGGNRRIGTRFGLFPRREPNRQRRDRASACSRRCTSHSAVWYQGRSHE